MQSDYGSISDCQGSVCELNTHMLYEMHRYEEHPPLKQNSGNTLIFPFVPGQEHN